MFKLVLCRKKKKSYAFQGKEITTLRTTFLCYVGIKKNSAGSDRNDLPDI